jgi:methyltransferase
VLVAEPWLFPLMVVLHAGLVIVPLLEVLWLGRPFVPALAAGAGALFVLATALRIWMLRTIGRAWNVRVLRPQPGSVVTAGPYTWIRHPNYLAVIVEIASLPLLHTAWISCLVLSTVNAFVLFQRIRVEEEQLAAVPAWREAMADRPRLIPRLF